MKLFLAQASRINYDCLIQHQHLIETPFKFYELLEFRFYLDIGSSVLLKERLTVSKFTKLYEIYSTR